MTVDGLPLRLEAVDVSKKFGPVQVLSRVKLEVKPGEIHALLGANGAGKSTLCRIIAGLIPKATGNLKLDGVDYHPANKPVAESRGVQIVQQELNLIATMSVAENMMLNRLPNFCGVIAQAKLRDRARKALDRLGLSDVAPDHPVSELGLGTRQMVEIAAALDRDCRLLILDEPTAALGREETQRLFDWLTQLRRQGVGVIYVSHRLEEVLQICDRVTVLRDGRSVGMRLTGGLTTQAMVELMTGEAYTPFENRAAAPASTSTVALRVEQLTREPGFRNVSFELRAGERLGIAGLVGSGRTELLRAIFGADRAQTGTVRLGESAAAVRFRRPHQAVRAGIAMVTEDRQRSGLLLPQSVRVNTTLCSLRQQCFAWGVISRSRETRAAERMHDQMETRCRDVEQTVATLSGGNQQKVVVSKWLERNADVFLFDEPTRGVDIAAREKIHRLFESLARRGKAIIIVSSDEEELLENCDTIAVMSAGQLVSIGPRREWTRESILQQAFSGYLDSP